jgi:LysM repeat protein
MIIFMGKTSKFTLISWGVTLAIVLTAGGLVFWHLQTPMVLVTAAVLPKVVTANSETPQVASIPPVSNFSMLALPAIGRSLTLKTIVPERPRYAVSEHTVERGDSVFAISKEYSIKPDTLLWANYDVLNDSPDSIRPGQELNVPPTDGILYRRYTRQRGSTIQGKGR